MSFRRACFGCSPSTTARPPQNGSTYLRSAFASHIVLRCDTSHRFPPAHFKGGLEIINLFGTYCRGGPPWPPVVCVRIQEATASDLANMCQNHGRPRRAAPTVRSVVLK